MATTQDLAYLTDDYIVKRLWRVSSIERARVQVDTLRMMTDAYKCDMIDVLMSPKHCMEMLTEMWEPALPKEVVIEYVKQLTHVESGTLQPPTHAGCSGPAHAPAGPCCDIHIRLTFPLGSQPARPIHESEHVSEDERQP